MIDDLLHPKFAAALERVVDRVNGSIAALREAGPEGGHLRGAIDAVLAIGRGPKHLVRPQFVLLGHLGAGGSGDGEAVECLAAGVELLHLFMLVHDDVMDHGTVRRGAPTLHHALRTRGAGGDWETCGQLAIVVGDILHTRAAALLAEARCPEATSIVFEAAARAGVGQFHDLVGWAGSVGRSMQVERFRRALLDKGGHHSVAAPLAAGLRMADPKADVDLALRWGDHIGLALQALDDLQDLLAPAAVSGKDTLQDVREGRLSLPIFVLANALDEAEWGALRRTFGRGPIPPPERARLFHLLREHAVVDRSLSFIGEDLDAAAALVGRLEGPPAFIAGLRAAEAKLRTFATHLAGLPRDWG